MRVFFKFVLERNDIAPTGSLPERVAVLVESGIVSGDCGKAFSQIWNSFRNDVHHMNPPVAHIHFELAARRNLADLAFVEREVFATELDGGRLVPIHRKYWDLRADGTAPVFLRLE
ncbi:MAG: hypothetical protein EXQ50_10005 [Acidobacteria bacterium]|nr:hypothetical protein [Acidobacteriota bacterium]MSO62409.1 hypothetical protein [Acidobacteriota bacterium]